MRKLIWVALQKFSVLLSSAPLKFIQVYFSDTGYFKLIQVSFRTLLLPQSL